MPILNDAQDLFDLDDAEYATIEVPEWKIGGEVVTVRLKALSGIDRDAFESSLATVNRKTRLPEPALDNVRARLVALSAVNEAGQPLFRGTAAALQLGTKNAKALNRLYNEAAKLSGIDLSGIQEAVEDFDEGQSESSTTG